MKVGINMRNTRFFQKKFISGKFLIFFEPKNIFSDNVYKSKTLQHRGNKCFKAIGAIRFNFGDY